MFEHQVIAGYFENVEHSQAFLRSQVGVAVQFTRIISMAAAVFMSQRWSVDRNLELELYRDVFLLTLGKHRDAYRALILEYGSYQALLTRYQRA